MSSNIQFTKVCEHCGSTFIAQKCSTRFCSHHCAQLAYKARKRAEHVEQNQIRFDTAIKADVQDKDFLSPTQCAKLLGVCRRTIYNYLESNQIPCFQFKGKTRIRRADIDRLFDESNGYVKRPAKEREEITEFYTTKEVLAKFSISNSWLFKMAKDKNIPKTIHLGKTMWSKSHCDRIFHKKSPKVADEQRWYSYAEAMERYGMSRDQVGHYIKWYKLTTKKAGKYTFIDADEFDKLMTPPKI
jgi:excisionase family DNA binding protein